MSRIVIVGGGFGGVTLAQQLERRAPAGAEIVLLSSENHLVFSPMLAEAAGRTVSPLHIVVPGRLMVKRTRWLTARATEIDRSSNVVHYLTEAGAKGEMRYDQLVLACGSVINLSDVPGLAAYAYPLKTMGDAIALGNDLIRSLEEASAEPSAEVRRRLLTVVVIGGGFSGVEVAGQIAGLMRRVRRFYPLLREPERVILLHRGDRVLPELNAASLSEFALRKLREQNIDVRLHAEAREVTAGDVRLASGETIQAGTVVCTIGNTANPLSGTLGLPLDKGRLKTDADLRASGTENVWALGDCAAAPNAWDNKLSPATAQFATRQARQLAANLDCVLRGRPTRPFRYRPLGMLASIGHHNAVAEILGMKISGFAAWFLWRGVYLAKLPTVSRKIEVAIDWAWQLLFPPNIVQLNMWRTHRVDRAHYAAGEWIYHKGQTGQRFYVIQSGKASAYLDESASPVATLKPGDHFGEGALMAPEGRGAHSISMKAETPLDLVTLGRDDFKRLAETLGVLQEEIRRSTLGRRGFQGFLDLIQREPRLREMKVSDVMSSPAETLNPDLTLEQAIERFHGGRPGYPVADPAGRLIGYCGRAELYDALRALLPADTPIADFMRKAAPAASQNDTLLDAMVTLMRDHVEVLPVLSADGGVVGVMSPIDVFRKAIAPLRLREPVGV